MRYATISALAEGDLADIWVEIATDAIDTADRFIAELQALAQKLAEQPLMGTERPQFGRDVRAFPYRKYLIVYRPTAHGIGIARIVHGARDLTHLQIT